VRRREEREERIEKKIESERERLFVTV
jgi:hypothetical protein